MLDFDPPSRRLAAILIIVAATAAVYWPVLGHGFLNYDDGTYVLKNAHVQHGLTSESVAWAFTTSRASNWHPLTWLSHMLDWEMFGPWAGGHHLTNVLLHVANAIALFLLLTRMTASVARSAVVALLFAVHPLHVESVAWVAERKDVLSTLFWMLTLAAYLRYVERPGPGRLAIVAAVLALGLMAKPMLVTLPVVLLLLDYWPLRRRGAALIEKVPLVALAVASSVVTLVMQRTGGSVGSFERYPLDVRLTNALVSLATYLVKAFWPTGLAVFYPHPHDVPALWQVGGSAVLILGLMLLAIRERRRRPWLLAGWLWYLVTLIPVLGVIQVGGQARADRYTYLPLIGIFVIVAWGVPDTRDAWRRIFGVTALGAMAALMACAFVQVGYWRDSETLFRRALAVTEGNAVAHNNLGTALAERGRLDEATDHYRETIRINPRHLRAYNNLGMALAATGHEDDAIRAFERALDLDPGDADVLNNLGVVLAGRGQIDDAIDRFEEAVRLDPQHPHAAQNLARYRAQAGGQKE